MTVKDKLAGLAKTVRAFIMITVGLPVFLISIIVVTGGFPPLIDFLIFYGLMGIFYTGVLAADDFFDYESDKISRPYRSIPSKKLTRTDAIVFGNVIGLFVTLAIGVIFGRNAMIYVIIVIITGWIAQYIGCCTRIPFGVHFSTAFFAGTILTFLPIGIFAEFDIRFPLLFLWWFVWDIGHDCPSGIANEKGDRAAGRSTVPIVLGRKTAAKIAIYARVVSFIILAIAFYISGIGLLGYLGIISIIIVTMPFTLKLIRNPTEKNGYKTFKILTVEIPILGILLVIDTLLSHPLALSFML